MVRTITEKMLIDFEQHLREDEKQKNTIKKYLRDIRSLREYLGKKEITKELVMEYKQHLSEHYKTTSCNSMLVSVNVFLKWAGWSDCTVKAFKIQKACFRDSNRELTVEDYHQLLAAAKRKNQMWLYYVMLTICSTGIRIGELKHITVETPASRQVIVRNKGKSRMILLPSELCRRLRKWAKERGIESGRIFVTRSGKEIDRSNIHHAMKRLCMEADIEKSKVFPHNFRHLFAVEYYEKHRDLSTLSSLLGHTNINTTKIYTMRTAESKRTEIECLGLVV